MFRTLAVAPLTSRISARCSFHSSRPCLSQLLSTPIQPEAPAASGPPKKPRKRKTAVKKEKDPEPLVQSILQNSKLRHQLIELERLGQTITVDDVERYRPLGEPPSPFSSGYADQHRKMLKPLEKSFTKEQLSQILNLYEVSGATRELTKRKSASLLLEKWGWVQPDSPSHKTKTEVFSLKPSEVFFLMHESQNFVKWSRNRAVKLGFSQSPLSLTAKGPFPIVESIGAHIRSLRQEILSSTFSIPINATIPKSTVKTISSSCGTFIEVLPNSHFSVSYLKFRSAALAKTQRAILNALYREVTAQPPLFYHQVEDALNIIESPLYSVLPFSSSQTQSLLKQDTPTYRIESINGPMAGVDQFVPVNPDKSLTSLSALDLTAFDLRQWLHNLELAPGAKLIVEASPGNIVMAPVERQRFTVSSPLPGQLGLDSVIDWVRVLGSKNYRHAFQPCIPKSVYGFQTTAYDSFERLEYSAVPSPISKSNNQIPTPTSVLRCRIALHPSDDPSSTSELTEAPHLVLLIPDTFEQFHVECESGRISNLDVMIPDRPMDIRFTASAVEPLSPEKYPADLRNYASQMRDAFKVDSLDKPESRPQPPLSIFYDNQLYVLTAFNYIRQNQKDGVNEAGIANAPFEIITETIADIEDRLSSGRTTCQVSCDPRSTDVQWAHFMGQCEWLTQGVTRQSFPSFFEENLSDGL